ncbi:hypothetical protein M413DRAFT_271835 [Hebeloma cylindrosporum]|uniref:Uncharacterized protein n=1 Tax=Hebeloma cylindrosporum TaxID=76867 RepID=A0A0C3CT51_HEBCY|nr:hypothetical protein M413DRAFT_271835 [Hebeloma cylindrosporum h7]
MELRRCEAGIYSRRRGLVPCSRTTLKTDFAKLVAGEWRKLLGQDDQQRIRDDEARNPQTHRSPLSTVTTIPERQRDILTTTAAVVVVIRTFPNDIERASPSPPSKTTTRQARRWRRCGGGKRREEGKGKSQWELGMGSKRKCEHCIYTTWDQGQWINKTLRLS